MRQSYLTKLINFDTLVALTRGVAPLARVEAEAHTFFTEVCLKMPKITGREKTWSSR